METATAFGYFLDASASFDIAAPSTIVAPSTGTAASDATDLHRRRRLRHDSAWARPRRLRALLSSTPTSRTSASALRMSGEHQAPQPAHARTRAPCGSPHEYGVSCDSCRDCRVIKTGRRFRSR
jgi:hypothetical protein